LADEQTRLENQAVNRLRFIAYTMRLRTTFISTYTGQDKTGQDFGVE